MSTMLEATIEKYLITRVEAAGGIAIKLFPKFVAGLPDRLVVLPGRFIEFVELKAPGGRLRPVQRRFHKRLAALGIDVLVIASKAEVDELLQMWIMTNRRFNETETE